MGTPFWGHGPVKPLPLILGALVGLAVGLLLSGCGMLHGNGRGSLVLGYQKTENHFEITPASVPVAGTEGKSYGNGNIALALDTQAIVSKGSGNSNNVSPELSVPAAGF